MISYFYSNQGKFKSCEDSLTAVIFDTLKYLPTELFWKIIKDSLYHDKLPFAAGDLLSISFWDKWDPEGTSNKRYVEPDVFLRFQEFDIIIEAKRYDKFQQLESQLQKEVIAYHNEFKEESKNLYFIKLGGLHSRNNEVNLNLINKEVVICKTDWSRMLHQVVLVYNDLKETNLSAVKAYNRILEDCIRGFALHQFYEKSWLSDLHLHSPINEKSLHNFFTYAGKS